MVEQQGTKISLFTFYMKNNLLIKQLSIGKSRFEGIVSVEFHTVINIRIRSANPSSDRMFHKQY